MSIGGGGLSVGSIAARLTVDNTQWSRGFQSARQDLRGFNQDVQGASRNWQQIGQRMQSFGRSMTIGVTTPILAAGAGMLKAAGDAEAAATRLETTFGPAVQDINSYLRELQEVAPASMADLQNSASDAMGALTTLGIEQERANEMTQEALEVTANLSAHMDRDFSETLRTIQAGYAGNTQSLRDMAYNITQAEIESRALEMGLVDQGEAVMGAERAMAVHNLVMEQSEGIMGAAEAQADTFNVQLRDLWATVQDTGAAFGEILIPHLSEFMEFASGVVTALGDLDTSTQTLILGIGGAAAAIGPLAVAAGTLMTVLAPISGTMVAIGAAAAGLVTAGVLVYQNWDALSERFPVLTSGFERIIDVIRAVGSIAADVFPPLVASVVTAGDIILQTWESIANIINTQVDNLVLTVQGGADAIKALAEGDFRGAYGALSDAGEEVLRNNEDLFDDISDGWFGVADAPETYGNALEFVEGLIGDVGSAWDDMTGSGEYATAAMEGFTQRTGELGTAAMESKSQIDDTADSVDHLGRQYQLLHDRVDEAAGRMGHWESMNADAEQALELLEEEIERTGDSTGELTRKKEDLEWWIRRTEGGIRDEGQAYIDTQADLAEYHRRHDELKGALDDGKISQEEYKDAVRELNEEFGKTNTDALQDGIDEAGGLVDDMIEGLRELLEDLGILDETEAEPTVNVNLDDPDSNLPPLFAAFRELDNTNATPTVNVDLSDPDSKLPPLFTALYGIPEEEETVITVDTSDPDSDIPLLMQALGDIPEETNTTANADTTPAETDIGFLHGAIDGVPRTFTITPTVDLTPSLEAINELDARIPHSPAEKGPLSVPPNWDWVFGGLSEAAERHSEEAIEHTRNFAQAVQAGFQAGEAQISFSGAAVEFEEGGGTLPDDDFITDLKRRSEHMVQSMGDSAALMDEEFIEHASTYNSAVSSGWRALDDAVGFASTYSEAIEQENFGLPSDAFISDLKFRSEHAARSLGDSAQVLDMDAVESADRYGQALEGIWGGLGAHVQFAADHTEAIQDENFGLPSDEFISEMVTQAERTADEMIAAARELEDHEIASELGESLENIFGGLGEVVRFVVETQGMSRRQGLIVAEDQFVQMLREIIEAYSRALQRVEQELGTEVLEGNQRIAEMLAPVVDLIPGLADAFDAIEEMSELSDDKMATFEGNIETVMDGIHRLTELAAGGVADSQLFVAQMQAIMAALEQASAVMDGGSSGGSGGSGGGTAGGGTFTQVPVMDNGAVVNEPTLALLAASARAQPEIMSPEPLMRRIVREESGAGGGNAAPVIYADFYMGGERIDSRIEGVVRRTEQQRFRRFGG